MAETPEELIVTTLFTTHIWLDKDGWHSEHEDHRADKTSTEEQKQGEQHQ